MERQKLAVTIIPKGTWPDSSAENRAYWLSRPPEERIEGAKRLRRKFWRLFHRQDLPPLSKAARVIGPYRT